MNVSEDFLGNNMREVTLCISRAIFIITKGSKAD